MRIISSLSILVVAVSAGVIFLLQNQAFSERYNAKEKFDQIWQQIKVPTEAANWLGLGVLGVFFVNLGTTFDRQSDWMPSNRKKYIHSQGLVASFEWKAHDSAANFSGLLKTGSDFGILRVSAAVQPSNNSLIPALSIKMFRDDVQSANFFAMYSLDGQHDLNFFANDLKNHVSEPKSLPLKLLFKRFKSQSSQPGKVGLSDAALWDSFGGKSYEPVVPYVLKFVPCPEIQTQVQQMLVRGELYDKTWKKQFEVVKSGQLVYRVFAYMRPDAQGQQIGAIYLKSTFRTSKAADENLFFRHQRIEDDIKVRPELADFQ